MRNALTYFHPLHHFHIKNILPHVVILICIVSCGHEQDQYHIHTDNHDVTVKLIKGHVNYLQCFVEDSLTSSWPLRYPVFQFKKGDINHDGVEDLAVGVFKKTRYDSVRRKRLFLFQVRNNAIIPLWLGSALSQPLEDFTVVAKDSSTVIRSIEKEKDNQFLVAEYEWAGFGLRLSRYIKRDISLGEATRLCDQ